MSTPGVPKVAGNDPTVALPAHNAPIDRLTAAQDQLAAWISELTTLHDLTERVLSVSSLDDALAESLRAGAALTGSSRALLTLLPGGGHTGERAVGWGLAPADLGQLETVPREDTPCARLLDSAAEAPGAPLVHRHIAGDPALHPRHREVAARLGLAAAYAVPLRTRAGTLLGAAVWFRDEPGEPGPRARHLLDLYLRCAVEHLAHHLEVERARRTLGALRAELQPSRMPRVPGVALAVRHHAGPRGGGDFFDALALPEGALGLAVGSVTGSGPAALAATGSLRAGLRAYAVMEGEDPVAVLSDVELLMRLTEPARTATALFGHVQPAARHVVLAGAGHCPPLVTGPHRTEYAETGLSAPLGVLSCWEAPSVEVTLRPGESLLLYSDGLLHRTGMDAEKALAALHAAAAAAPTAAREDPGALADHVLGALLPDGRLEADHPEDVVLLAARF